MLTRQEYDEKIGRLRVEFPWVGASVLRPTPGHLDILRDLLRDIDEIARPLDLAESLDFLRVDSDANWKLDIFVEIDGLVSARARALHASIGKAHDASRKTCAACGENGDPSLDTRRLCGKHGERSGLFSDVPEAAAGDAKQAEPESNAVTAEPPTETNDEQSDALVPRVRVFEPADADGIMKKSRGMGDHDQRERLNNLAERLKATPFEKPLAVVPTGWEEVIAALLGEFPNFAEVIDVIGDQFALNSLADHRLGFPHILLAGPPGVGKTELAFTIAQRFGVNFQVFDLASADTASDLCGSDSHWSNCDHGRLFEHLVFGPTANPIFVLEELDKVSKDPRHSAIAPLHGLLEKRTAGRFIDLSVKELPLDARHIIWFATANCLDRIPEPVLSRFNVFEVQAPDRKQSLQIARSIYRRLRSAASWGHRFEEELPGAVANVLSGLVPREIRACIERGFGRAARKGRSGLVVSDLEFTQSGHQSGIGFLAGER